MLLVPIFYNNSVSALFGKKIRERNESRMGLPT